MEIPACAGMTVVGAGMTVVGAGMKVAGAGMKVVSVGMTALAIGLHGVLKNRCPEIGPSWINPLY